MVLLRHCRGKQYQSEMYCVVTMKYEKIKPTKGTGQLYLKPYVQIK